MRNVPRSWSRRLSGHHDWLAASTSCRRRSSNIGHRLEAMDDLDMKEKFDRLAKCEFQNLCRFHGESIYAVYRDLALNPEYSEAEKRVYRESLDWAVLFCEDFEYASDGGEIEHGNFLHLACRWKRHHLVEQIIQKLREDTGRETIQQVVNKESRRFRRTPLHEMVRWSPGSIPNMSHVEPLLEECSIEGRDCNGMTPVHFAVQRHQGGGVCHDFRLLRSLLIVAAKRGHWQVVDASDSQGRTPADLAIGAGTTAMLDFCAAVLMTSSLITEDNTETFGLSMVTKIKMSITSKILTPLLSMEKPAIAYSSYRYVLTQAFQLAVTSSDLQLALRTLTHMRQFLRDGFTDVVLTSPEVVNAALELAVDGKCPSLVEMVYEQSKLTVHRKVKLKTRRKTFRFVCDVDEVNLLAVLLHSDGALVPLLDTASLATGLQKTIASNTLDFLTLLCTKVDRTALYSVDPAILDDVLHCACKHRLTTILKETRIVELVGASISQRTIEVQLELLCNELKATSRDVSLVAICASKEVVRECTGETCDAIAKTFSIDGLFVSLEEVCGAGLLRKASMEVKQKVLLKAAEHGGLSLASSCIESGALHGLKQWMSPSPVAIAMEKGHNRLARMLQRALDSQNLLALGEECVDSILLRVGGPPGAGKSTLVGSLKASRLSAIVRRENQADEGVRNYLARTKGIKVHAYKDKRGTQYHVLDLGGHDDFAAAHQLFIGQGEVPIINAIVISSLSEREEMLKETMKWCAFYASRYRPRSAMGQTSDPTSNHRQQPVVVIATRLGEANVDQKRIVFETFGLAKQRYGGFLGFQDGPSFLDARKSWAEETQALRRTLASLKKNLLQRSLSQPALCRTVQRALPEIRKVAQGPIILRDKLYTYLAHALTSASHDFGESVLASHDAIFEAVLRKMSDAAEIISFQKPSLKKYLVIEPQWLLSHIVGILMSPEHFPPPHVVYQHGRTKRKLAEAAVDSRHVPGKDTLEMVAQLGLCILEEEDMIAPSKLDTKRDATTWIARADLDMYFGIRFSCEHVAMSPALFPQLQVHLYNKFLDLCGQVSKLWKDGIRVTLLRSSAEGLLEAQRDQMAINIAVRGSSSSPRDAYQLLQLLREQVLYMAEEFSPGSDMSMKILSSKELSALADKGSIAKPLIAYKEEDVRDAMESAPRPIRSNDGTGEPEDPFSLMVLPPTHLLLMASTTRTRFCNVVNTGNDSDGDSCCWPALAKRLNLPDISQQITRATPDPTGELLNAWSHQSARNTVERLLDVVKTLQHQEAVTILKDELHRMTNETITAYPASRESEVQGPDSVRAFHETQRSPSEHTPYTVPFSFAEGARSGSPSATSQGIPPTKPGIDAGDNGLPTYTATAILSAERSMVVSPNTKKQPPSKLFPKSIPPSAVAMPEYALLTTTSPTACATAEPDAAANPHYTLANLAAAKSLEHGTAHVPQRSTGLQSGKTPVAEATMMKIASSFFNFFDCEKLAVFLELDQESGFVSSLQSANPHALPGKIAFAVMRQWVREKGSAATGPRLHSVLRDDLKMASVAGDFARDLCNALDQVNEEPETCDVAWV